MPLIDRSSSDPNFIHTLGLIASCAAWAESLPVDYVIDVNDLNMIALPVEIALAFIGMHAGDQTDLGAACRSTLELLTQFRAAENPANTNPEQD